jgi:hypothetical protein
MRRRLNVNTRAGQLDFYQRLTPELLLPLVPLVIFACASCAIAQPATTPLLLMIAKGLAVVTGMALIGALLPIYVLLLFSFCVPLVTISADGLSLSKFYLRWQDMKCVHLQKYWGRLRVFIVMNDPEAFLAAVPRSSARILRDQFRATGGINVPSVRGYSDADLSALLEQFRINRKGHHQTDGDQTHDVYRRRTPNESAVAFAVATFGVFFLPRWFPLMDCVKHGNVNCLLTNLMWATVIGVGAYLVFLVALTYVYKRFPRFDVWDLQGRFQNRDFGRD